jgi:hypothetical protein
MRLAVCLSLFSVSCAGLEPLEPEVCGNGVIEGEAGEDCDLFANGALGSSLYCAAPGEEHACKYVCDADTSCPTGWSCGPDRVCRYASGELDAPAASPELFLNDRFRIVDADRDGEQDLLALFPSSVAIYFGDGAGGFRDVSEQRFDGALDMPVYVDSTPPQVSAAMPFGVASYTIGGDRRFNIVLYPEPSSIGEPVRAIPVHEDTMYLWTVPSGLAVKLRGFEEPKVIPRRTLESLASTAYNGEELVFAFKGAFEVHAYDLDLVETRVITSPGPITDGVVFRTAEELLLATDFGVARVERGETVAELDVLLDIYKDRFPVIFRGNDYYAHGHVKEALVAGEVLAAIAVSGRSIYIADGRRTIAVDTLDPARNLTAGDLDADGLVDLAFIEENASGGASISVVWNNVTGFDPQVSRIARRDSFNAIGFSDDALSLFFRTGNRMEVETFYQNAGRTAATGAPHSGARTVAAGRFLPDRGVETISWGARFRVNELTGEATCTVGQVAGVFDHDGDGFDSLISLDGHTLRAISFTNAGGALVSSCNAYELPGALTNIRKFRVADLDLDGARDLLIEATPLVILFSFAGAPVTLSERGFSAVPLNADGDSLPELAVLGPDGVRIAKLELGSKQYALLEEPRVAMEGFAFGSIEAADFDHDGLLDLAFTDRSQVHLRYLRAHGPQKERP